MSPHARYFAIDIPYGTCTGFIRAQPEIIFIAKAECTIGLQWQPINKRTDLKPFFLERK
jgi:hypothetical protein